MSGKITSTIIDIVNVTKCKHQIHKYTLYNIKTTRYNNKIHIKINVCRFQLSRINNDFAYIHILAGFCNINIVYLVVTI